MPYRPGDPVGPIGLEAQAVQYDCLTMGQRETEPEGFILRSISGLDDAEIRRSAEALHTQHGEIFVSSYYGGRTIVLEGSIRAGNLDSLRNLQEYMKLALSDVGVEKPLILRAGSPELYDRFFFGDALNAYSVYSGAGTLSILNRTLAASNTTEKAIVHSARKYGDGITVIQFTIGATTPTLTDGIGPIIKAIDSNNFLFGRLAKNKLEIVKRVAGVDTVLATVTSGSDPGSSVFTESAFGTYWMEMQIDGNSIRATVFGYDPIDAGWPRMDPEFAPISLEHVLVAGDASTFGSGVTGYSGVRWVPYSTEDVVQKLRVLPEGTRDVMLFAAKSGSIAMREQQDSGRVERSFQLTFRASDPRIYSTIEHGQTLTVAAEYEAPPKTYYRTYNKKYSWHYVESLVEFFTGPDLVDYVSNVGNFPSYPTIVLYGPLDEARVKNYTTGEELAISGTIASGSSVVINQMDKTIVDEDLNNLYSKLNGSSDWVSLAPGLNSLRLYSRGPLPGTPGSMVLKWRDAWI